MSIASFKEKKRKKSVAFTPTVFRLHLSSPCRAEQQQSEALTRRRDLTRVKPKLPGQTLAGVPL